jgi:parallel beta-helix repeat protein
MFAFPISRRRGDRPTTRRPQIRRSRPLLELLEGRQLLTAQAFDVLKTSDYNPATTSLMSSTAQNTLRWAILESELPGNAGSTIDFDIPGTGVKTITPTSILPAITATVTINGLTQAGASATKPMVVISGSTATTSFNTGKAIGLELQASNSTIEGLVIDAFGNGGLWLDTASGTTTGAVSGDTIADDFIGVNAAGTASASNGNFPLRLNDGANHNTITGCVISGNNVVSLAPGSADAGVHINDGSYDNVITNNKIGTNSAGTAAVPNAGSGVIIDSGSYGNTIGGTTAAAANVISGNVDDGVHIAGAGTAKNVVEGNFIGTDSTSTRILGNGEYGVEVQQSNSNTIGGGASGAGNIISANGEAGVELDSGSTTTNGVTTTGGSNDNSIQGNSIGAVAVGANPALGNGNEGVEIQGGSDSNTVGGTTTLARNVISGNLGFGSVYVAAVYIESGSNSNVVEGDYVGTDSTGEYAVGNQEIGVRVDSSDYNTVGGTAAGAGNVISGNTSIGLKLTDGYTSGMNYNMVQGNDIGTDALGLKAIPNGDNGLVIDYGSDGNTVGGTTTAARNVISGNAESGVYLTTGLQGDPVSDNLVEGNYIGTNKNGNAALPNGQDGVDISGSFGNTIGGTATGAGNVISGNTGDGVYILSGSSNNTVQGNYVGTDSTGEVSLGNLEIGVAIDSSTNNLVGGSVGGTALGAGNVISGNGSIGVKLTDGPTSGMNDNVVAGNLIGTDVKGLIAIKNLNDGVVIDYGSNGNTIGGTSAADRNVISGNLESGVVLSTGAAGQPVSLNLVEDNLIGTNLGGTASVPNHDDGVDIEGSSKNSIVGNTISGNGQDGVYITESVYFTTNSKGQQVTNPFDSSDNVLTANTIGGTKALGNASYGVAIDLYSTGNIIGGTSASAGNMISGNGSSGVYLTNNVGSNNAIEYDVIDSNGGSGVYLYNVTDATTVTNCTIELNSVDGIWMRHSVSLATGTDTVTKNVLGQIVTTSS